MTNDDRGVEPGSDTDLAIERALEAANLRAGDATTTAVVVCSVWTFRMPDRRPNSATSLPSRSVRSMNSVGRVVEIWITA